MTTFSKTNESKEKHNTLNIVTDIENNPSNIVLAQEEEIKAPNDGGVNESQEKLLLPKIHDDRFPDQIDFKKDGIEKSRKYGKR